MKEFTFCKLEIYIPETHLPALQEILQTVNAGHIGSYDCCLLYAEVISCWRPLEGSQPYSGEKHRLSTETELKVEVTCRRENLDSTIHAIKNVHPYEVPVINVIPLYRTSFDENK